MRSLQLWSEALVSGGAQWAPAPAGGFSSLQTHPKVPRVPSSAPSPAFSTQGLPVLCLPPPLSQRQTPYFPFPGSLCKQIPFLPAHPPPLAVSICSAWPSSVPIHSPPPAPLCSPHTPASSSFHALSVPGFLYLNPIWHTFALSSFHLIPLHKMNFNET